MSKRIVLTAALRVKNEAKHLPRCLANLERFCDHVVAYDDGSTDGTLEILRSHPLVRHVVSFEKDFYHETMDRSVALALATLTEPDWILRIDADEELDDWSVRRIRELLAIDGFKAWAPGRFNFVDGRTHGDMAEQHWCLFRYVPGKVFYHNTKFHQAFPNLDKVEGKWGLCNLRVRHYGYEDKSAKQAQAKSDGYFFGDYLTPYFRWEETPEDTPILYREVDRPWYMPYTQKYVDITGVYHNPEHRRLSEPTELDRCTQMAWMMIHNLRPVEARQAIEKAHALLTVSPDPAREMLLRFYEGVLAYETSNWDRARDVLFDVRARCIYVWPFLAFAAGTYLERAAVLRREPPSPVRDPDLVPYQLYRHQYVNWFFEELARRNPKGIYLFGAGAHSWDLDDRGVLKGLDVRGFVDDEPDRRAVNKLPIVTLDEAREDSGRVLLLSTDRYEPQLVERFNKRSVAPMKVQPMYWTLWDRPFWYDERDM